MEANPLLGVLLHALGGLAAASFYIPYQRVRGWAWETFWIVGGAFAWILAPWLVASLNTDDLLIVLDHAPRNAMVHCYLFGVLWGIGGLMYGLTMRYLGISLGVAIALGFCAAFGTLLPPMFNGQFHDLLHTRGGWATLAGVSICLLGIAVCGLAGMRKERELTDDQKQDTVSEFSFSKGILVAIIAGVMSACMAFIIIFGTLWGLWLREWRGVHANTIRLVWVGIGLLIVSTVVVGWGNYLAG